jgi:dUTP pyrophosphatase
MKLKIEIKLFENGKIPTQQTLHSAGFDLFAGHDAVILPNQVQLIKLGFAIKIADGFEAQIRSRSGLALKKQVMVLNSPGTIDSDYVDEVGVLLMNFGKEEFIVNKHDRIAQMVFNKVEFFEFQEVEQLEKTFRDGGWGSTGIK